MSTATNHRKRSHRSHYRTRMFNGSRKSVIKPTIGRTGIMGLIRKIRRAKSEKKGEK